MTNDQITEETWTLIQHETEWSPIEDWRARLAGRLNHSSGLS
jgi:hypothetical protein